MDANSAINQEIVKDALLRHAQSGGVTLEELKSELTDVPAEEIESVVDNLLFGGQVEETDDGKLLMTNFF